MAKRRVSPAGTGLIGLLIVGAIWVGDGIYRIADKPDEGAVSWQDEVTTENILLEAEPAVTNSGNTEGTVTMPIQDAHTSMTTQTQDVPEGYTTVPQDQAGVHTGMLVQIDQNHAYTGNPGEMTTFASKNESYRMKRMDLSIKEAVVTAMNSMGSAYVSDNGSVNLMVYSTIAPYDVAGSLYPDALPDRSCGYSIDLCLLNADETISKFTEPNAWLKEYSWKYGFVFSYTAEDAAATGVQDAPYHLRYVGEVHAGIMHEQNLTLTEYYAYLKKHTVSVPLYYTVGDTMYTVYYVPAAAGTTEVPVPLDKEYELSGNNTDGFIVTVKG